MVFSGNNESYMLSINLSKYMEREEMDEEDLSRKSGVDGEVIREILRGNTTVSCLNLGAISRALSLTPSELLGIDGKIYRLFFCRTEEEISVYDEICSVPTLKNVKVYGLSVGIFGKYETSYRLTFRDISSDGERVRKLCRQLNKSQPRIEHLEDLIEDFI